MKKIVVGIDGSRDGFESYKKSTSYFPNEDILLEAVFVADERKIQVPFIYSGAAFDIAYERLYIPVSKEMIAFNEQLKKDITDFGEKCLGICRAIKFKSSVKQRFTLLHGDPSEEILDLALDSDLIVVGQRGESSSVKRELIGSTTEELIRRSKIPVLVVTGEKVPDGKMLIVYEGGRSSDLALDFFIKNLTDLDKPAVILIPSKTIENRQDLDKKASTLRNMGKDIVLEECRGHLVKKVQDLSEKLPIDLIVLPAHGRHKITDFLLGSETAHIVRKSSVPVFIVH